MHVPTVTDQQLEKVIESAASPVAVLFAGGDPDRAYFAFSCFRRIAEELDAEIIFLRISIDENPTTALSWQVAETELLVFHKGGFAGRLVKDFSGGNIRHFLKAVQNSRRAS